MCVLQIGKQQQARHVLHPAPVSKRSVFTHVAKHIDIAAEYWRCSEYANRISALEKVPLQLKG